MVNYLTVYFRRKFSLVIFDLGKSDHVNWLKVNHELTYQKISLSEQGKQKLEAILAFIRIFRLLVF